MFKIIQCISCHFSCLLKVFHVLGLHGKRTHDQFNTICLITYYETDLLTEYFKYG